MPVTPNLEFQLMGSNQSQKHVTFNESMLDLDVLVQLTVLSRQVSTPPVAPSLGDRYIVGDSATDLWSGQEGRIALWLNSHWKFFSPKEGWVATILDESNSVRYDGDSWVEQPVATGPWKAFTRARILSEEVTMDGAFVDTDIVIPDRAIVLAVSTRIVEDITGATSYDCGISGDLAKFGGLLGILRFANNVGVIGPEAFYADTPIRLTANGGAFTGGVVRVAIHFLDFGVPDA